MVVAIFKLNVFKAIILSFFFVSNLIIVEFHWNWSKPPKNYSCLKEGLLLSSSVTASKFSPKAGGLQCHSPGHRGCKAKQTCTCPYIPWKVKTSMVCKTEESCVNDSLKWTERGESSLDLQLWCRKVDPPCWTSIYSCKNKQQAQCRDF